MDELRMKLRWLLYLTAYLLTKSADKLVNTGNELLWSMDGCSECGGIRGNHNLECGSK